jgi:hypothetical protein
MSDQFNPSSVALEDIKPLNRFIESATDQGFSNESQLRWWFRPENRKESGLDKVLIDVNGRKFVVVPWFLTWLMSRREAA